MSGEASTFERACELLAKQTSLKGPVVRGSVRLALKDAGLDWRTATFAQMKVVFEKLMPKRLMGQGLAQPEAEAAARAVATKLNAVGEVADNLSPTSMFERLDRASWGAGDK